MPAGCMTEVEEGRMGDEGGDFNSVDNRAGWFWSGALLYQTWRTANKCAHLEWHQSTWQHLKQRVQFAKTVSTIHRTVKDNRLKDTKKMNSHSLCGASASEQVM